MSSANSSQAGLKCILEYLKPNRRIHIAARSKAIQDINESVPLHINQLEIDGDNLNIDGIFYWIAGLRDPTVKEKYFEIHRTKNPKNIRSSIPKDLVPVSAIQTMIRMIERYESIYVGKLSYLDVFPFVMSELPAHLKFFVKKIDFGNFDLAARIKMLHPQNPPLREVECDVNSLTILKHPLVEKANVFIINKTSIDFPLESLKNKHIALRYPITQDQIMNFIQNWRNVIPKIGTSAIFQLDEDKYTGWQMMENVARKFKQPMFRYDGVFYVAVPLNDTLNILVTDIEKEPSSNQLRIVVKKKFADFLI